MPQATQIETPEDALMRPQGGVFSSPLARAAQESPVVAVGAAAAGGPPRPKQQYLTNSEKDGAPFVEAEFEGYIAHFFDIDTEPGGFITGECIEPTLRELAPALHTSNWHTHNNAITVRCTCSVPPPSCEHGRICQSSRL